MVGGNDGRDEQHRDTSQLGDCPRCGTTIQRTHLVIEYRTTEEWPRILAECPECLLAVRPT